MFRQLQLSVSCAQIVQNERIFTETQYCVPPP